MDASILKSTESKNGGYVNTLLLEGVAEDKVLGKVIVKDRYYFKSPDAIVTKEDEPVKLNGFALGNYNINKIESVDENTGETRINKWITPKA